MDWRFIDSGFSDGFTNMAVDEAIMNCYKEGLSQPVLRLYGWKPPAVSLGYFQNIDKAVDIEACKTAGIDVVRRMTGGRAVLHEHEITYCIVIGEDYPDIPKSVVESYKFLCTGIIEGLRMAGADVSMEQGRKNVEKGSSACFDSPSRYEIIYDGKKVVGSAQARKNGVILQHGSILLDKDIEKQISIFRFQNDNQRQKVRNQFKNKVAALSEILGKKVDNEEIKNCLIEGFKKTMGINFFKDRLSNDEKQISERLRKDFSNSLLK